MTEEKAKRGRQFALKELASISPSAVLQLAKEEDKEMRKGKSERRFPSCT